MTELEACRLLSRELPATAVGVRRALRAATFWGAFHRAYTPEHHALGLCVLSEAEHALEYWRLSRGALPVGFVAACKQLLECCKREGVLT